MTHNRLCWLSQENSESSGGLNSCGAWIPSWNYNHSVTVHWSIDGNVAWWQLIWIRSSNSRLRFRNCTAGRQSAFMSKLSEHGFCFLSVLANTTSCRLSLRIDARIPELHPNPFFSMITTAYGLRLMGIFSVWPCGLPKHRHRYSNQALALLQAVAMLQWQLEVTHI